MGQYPCLEINLKKIRENAVRMLDMCHSVGVEPAGVTKVCCGQREVACALVQAGFTLLADSRLENIEKYADLPVKKLLLRLPMPSAADETVRLADYSLVSEQATVRALGEAAARQGRTHGVIVMLEMGDLREGAPNEQALEELARCVLREKSLRLMGVGANFVCFGGAQPTRENLTHLVGVRDMLSRKLGVEIPWVSGGSSSCETLIRRGEFPAGVNQLRTGALMHTGIGLNDWVVPGFHTDAYVLKAEIIELNVKPSMPYGVLGTDAFGRVRSWEDRGDIRRAIVAVGRQDVEMDVLIPLDEGVRILGGSSDHMLVELASPQREYRVGDVMSFAAGYVSVLRSCTSPYVRKVVVDG